MTAADKQGVDRELLECGAGIDEMNCARKHFSRTKGRHLAVACMPVRSVTLAISDVPGDDPAVIAGGPTVADPTACAEALSILDRHRIDVPPAVRETTVAGLAESPGADREAFRRAWVRLTATPKRSLEAAARIARFAGLRACVLSDRMEGESREVGMVHAAMAMRAGSEGSPFVRPCVILSGGETTVTVRAAREGARKGRGGRAGEFCLGTAKALQGAPGIWALAADTDGIDGVEDTLEDLSTPRSCPARDPSPLN